MAAEPFVFNGVDATTGSYLLPPAPREAVSRWARDEQFDHVDLDELRWAHERATDAVFGPREGLDPRDLAQVGWGVVFTRDARPAVREALRELLEHRRHQAGAVHPGRYREFWGESAYRPGEAKAEFLARNGVAPGPVDPDRMPYYILLVGGGGEIPFSVQYQLDVQYAVGRLALDTPEEYRRYAAAVVAAETENVPRRRTITFFAPENRNDRATARSRTELIDPLVRRLADEHADWQVRTAVAEDATKECLSDLLGGNATPGLLFTAGHGAAWPAAHPAQPRNQGALVCQEWPGPNPGEPLSADQYFAAADVPDDAHIQGLITFHVACFGAGTPEWDGFAHRGRGTTRARLAPHPMISALPRRLLGHPRGGVLAVAGHIDRAWSYSFSWPGAGHQTEVYRSCLERLLDGHPIGSAFDYLNQRYAELSSDLSTLLEDVKYGRRPDSLSLSTTWTANNDARGFVVLGDPAVRLPAATTPVPPGPERRAERLPSPVVCGSRPASAMSGRDDLRGQGAGDDPSDDGDTACRRLIAATERLVRALARTADEITGFDDAVDAAAPGLPSDLRSQAHAARSELPAALGPALRNLLDVLERR